jgi:hypothetical protein
MRKPRAKGAVSLLSFPARRSHIVWTNNQSQLLHEPLSELRQLRKTARQPEELRQRKHKGGLGVVVDD